ncbi:hypothetical protein B0T16DRAFT_455501 [Cercophora newfieldiana]|uniref:Rhodopsin domain-containing protein n=1 Tax=Cercophora newfieldiana TaxID=92897 RepID=A0AA40CQU0_9PEZI|nr:hypothetical protein B0T16DRAFT_455501 [Cercophora newfieldiana]
MSSTIASPSASDATAAATSTSSAATPSSTATGSSATDLEDYSLPLNVTIWFLSGIATLFLTLRLYAKIWRKRPLWWDDYVLIAGWLSLILSCAFLTVCTHFDLGKHGEKIKPKNLSPLLKYSYFAGFFSILAAVWSKSSFAITLLGFSQGRTRKVIWFILISINIVMGGNALLQWIQCWPVPKLWLGGEGVCWLKFPKARAINTVVAVYSGTADIVLALLPWKIIWNAKIRRSEKLGALFAMSMGVFAGAASFSKILTLVAIGNADMITLVSLYIVATAEGAITIMAASIPILRALFHQKSGPTTPSVPSSFKITVDNSPRNSRV